uniref:Uncharacterized protein n=1 Tax=viral metagenome TaxID=1070528 RepID=A0A6H2A661_9ZZZZ
MTLKEAIKLQDELLGLLPEVGFNKYIASVRLGIEAMEAITAVRIFLHDHLLMTLPGETED